MTDAHEDPHPPFKAKFSERTSRFGATELNMELQFTPDDAEGWTATGTASVTRGSTRPPLDLEFQVEGTMTYNALSGVEPVECKLVLRNDESNPTIGTWLNVDLVAKTSSSPAFEPTLEFTGEYTWAQGDPNRVTGVVVEMTNLSFPAAG